MPDNKQLRSLKIVFIVLLLAIGLVSWFDYKRSHTVVGVTFDQIGMKIGKWEGTDMLQSNEDRKRSAQGDLVVRTYREKENSLHLVAIQERGDRHRVHSPVDCYTGLGWTVLKKENIVIESPTQKQITSFYLDAREIYKKSIPQLYSKNLFERAQNILNAHRNTHTSSE